MIAKPYVGWMCPNCGAMLNAPIGERVRVSCPDAPNGAARIFHVLLDAERQPELTALYEAPVRDPLPEPKIGGG